MEAKGRIRKGKGRTQGAHKRPQKFLFYKNILLKNWSTPQVVQMLKSFQLHGDFVPDYGLCPQTPL